MRGFSAITCSQLVELVTDYLEGALDRRRRRGLEAHLARCEGCEAYVDQLRAAIFLMGALLPSELSELTGSRIA